jgi:hypothetical protein
VFQAVTQPHLPHPPFSSAVRFSTRPFPPLPWELPIVVLRLVSTFSSIRVEAGTGTVDVRAEQRLEQ